MIVLHIIVNVLGQMIQSVIREHGNVQKFCTVNHNNMKILHLFRTFCNKISLDAFQLITTRYGLLIFINKHLRLDTRRSRLAESAKFVSKLILVMKLDY